MDGHSMGKAIDRGLIAAAVILVFGAAVVFGGVGAAIGRWIIPACEVQ